MLSVIWTVICSLAGMIGITFLLGILLALLAGCALVIRLIVEICLGDL